MLITLRVAGERENRTVDWPGVPREGETVELRDGRTVTVKRIVWCESDDDCPSPYVLLIDGD